MKRILLAVTVFVALLAALAFPFRLSGQRHTRYRFIDLGTLGGPHSYGSVNGDGFQLLNNSGVVASSADLGVPDPNAAFGCYVGDCFQAHAAEWRDGVIADLGALPINSNSAAGSINSRGWATGQSQTSTLDPVAGLLEFRAVLWKEGQIIDLGVLGDGTESLGIYLNDAGQVIGFSTTSTEPDQIGFLGFPTHTFIWEMGEKRDIGTLGGADALPGAGCSHPAEGVVTGGSTTSTSMNPDTNLPTIDPFLWRTGKLVDLGTLGGSVGFAQCGNRRGQVIGLSSVAAIPSGCAVAILTGGPADPGCHAFFWENGVMTDLGTLGGNASEAIWLNDSGQVVGSSNLAGDQLHHATFWHQGKIHDLGTVSGDSCSRGRALNASGQVVGTSTDCTNALHAFVWDQNDGIVDLNTVIPSGTGYQLTEAFNINDRGEILAKAAPLGFTPNDDEDLGHIVLLVPCDDEEADCGIGANAQGGRGPLTVTAALNSRTSESRKRKVSADTHSTTWHRQFGQRYIVSAASTKN
jgi:probable HAF family extracellular repeat protein